MAHFIDYYLPGVVIMAIFLGFIIFLIVAGKRNEKKENELKNPENKSSNMPK